MTESGNITCGVTRWFYRRMALMTTMLIGFALWFLYDGKIKYPKDNAQAALYKSFEEGALKYDEFKDSGRLSEWASHAEAEGFPVAANGEPIRWADYARENRLPSYENKKPKPHTEDDIKGQFRWASGFTLVGLAAAIYTLLNRKKSISADSEAYYDEKKRAVRYDRVFEVDKRKWDNKGLAYLKYKDETDKTVKTRIDDLKFGGAEEILERVISNFKGDLIETVQEEEVENSENEEITAEKINS